MTSISLSIAILMVGDCVTSLTVLMDAHAGAVGRPVHPSLLQVDDRLRDTPLCHAGPRPPKVRSAAAAFDVCASGDWSGFGWIAPRGIWGSSSRT